MYSMWANIWGVKGGCAGCSFGSSMSMKSVKGGCVGCSFGSSMSMKSVKGSRQPESRGVWNMSNCPNLAQTAAIEVRFSLNFAVVFDFMYFRFRPSKAKWIGDVLTNRYNVVNYLQRPFFKNTFVCCVIRRFYIDATMPLAPLGKAQQYCSVFNFQLVFRGLFLQLSALCLRTRTDLLRQ